MGAFADSAVLLLRGGGACSFCLAFGSSVSFVALILVLAPALLLPPLWSVPPLLSLPAAAPDASPRRPLLMPVWLCLLSFPPVCPVPGPLSLALLLLGALLSALLCLLPCPVVEEPFSSLPLLVPLPSLSHPLVGPLASLLPLDLFVPALLSSCLLPELLGPLELGLLLLLELLVEVLGLLGLFELTSPLPPALLPPALALPVLPLLLLLELLLPLWLLALPVRFLPLASLVPSVPELPASPLSWEFLWACGPLAGTTVSPTRLRVRSPGLCVRWAASGALSPPAIGRTSWMFP